MILLRSRLVVVGNVGRRRRLQTVIELEINFEDPGVPGTRKILLDPNALAAVSNRAQGLKSRGFSSSTVAAGVKMGRAIEPIVRQWIGGR
jgi:hypothetical protein